MRELFKRRREQVLKQIEPGIMILPAAPHTVRNHDVHHEYRQDSDFYYLSGFDEPESALLLINLGGERRSLLFLRPRDAERELWDGARAGIEGAVEEYGFDAAFPIAELASRLPELLANVPRVYYRFGKQRAMDEILFGVLDRVRGRARLGITAPNVTVDPVSVLGELRVIKEPEEIALLQKAIDITELAHTTLMARVRPGMREYQAEALLRSTFLEHGCERPAYPPIVGSGPNATILHYTGGKRALEDGELLLVDAGGEYAYYAADVTRTFPVNGRFNAEQRAIYEIVLEAQLAAIEATKPGATLEDVHAAATRVIAAGLIGLGLIEGPLAAALDERRYRHFFMHRTSHYLGLDVHDAGTYFSEGKPRPLAAGMVITIEPGIYIAQGAAGVAPEWRGIGVRIEDDALITSAGAEVLSARIPKQIAELEAISRN